MLKLLLFFILAGILPWILGIPFTAGPDDRPHRWQKAAVRYIGGITALWGSFQILAVPMILLKRPFHQLVYLWTGALVLLAVSAAVYGRRHTGGIRLRQLFSAGNHRSITGGAGMPGVKNRVKWPAWLILAAAFCVIGYQCSQYALRMHTDEDDSRFIVSAVAAYEHDTMYLENPATGEVYAAPEGEVLKDVASPWTLFIAAASRLIHLHPTILAHTVLPVWLLLVSYLVIFLAASMLFDDPHPGSTAVPAVPAAEKRAWFLLLYAAAVQFYGGTPYTRGAFVLSRIWQGKAVLAAFMIPWILLLTFGCEYLRNGGADMPAKSAAAFFGRRFLLLFAADLSVCLLTGVGILSAGTITGMCGLWSAVRNRQISSMLPYMVCCVPVLIYGGVYSLVK